MDTIAATNQFSHAPGIELANIVFAVLFASFFFLRHRQKYDAILIAVVGVMVGITVRYFVDRNIGAGTGFGLFALFSLISFRRKYSKSTFLYLFIALSIGILSSLMPQSEMVIFLAFGTGSLVLIGIAEWLVKSMKTCEMRVPADELYSAREKFESYMPHTRVKNIEVDEIRDGMAKITISYLDLWK